MQVWRFSFSFPLHFSRSPGSGLGTDSWGRGISHKANKLLTQHMNDNISDAEQGS